MNALTQKICAWCGPAATVTWLLGFWVMAGFIPPPSPSESAQQIADMYAANPTMIRLGLFVTMMGAALIGPFVAVISVQMKRVEGRYAPLAYAQLGLGMLMILMFIIPNMLMETAAFRLDRDPKLIQLLNDAGWIPFVGGFMCTFIQLVAIALCVFQDRQQRVFARWYGYFTAWVAMLLIPAGIIFWFKSGPFAWNGALAFWLVLVVFCAWFLATAAVVIRAINGQVREEQQARSADPDSIPAMA